LSWPSLGRDEIHIWDFNVDVGTSCLPDLECLLSPDEITRADRFHFKRDRARFVAARGLLRRVLSQYTGIEAKALRFDYSDFGKPLLRPAPGTAGLCFSASLSDEQAMIALRLHAEIGIDVERLRAVPHADRLAQHLLTAEELAEFALLGESQRGRRFLEYWVRKEAIAKLLGKGLQQSFDHFGLHPWSGENAQLLRIGPADDGPALWVIPISTADSVGAVAIDTAVVPIRRQTLPVDAQDSLLLE